MHLRLALLALFATFSLASVLEVGGSGGGDFNWTFPVDQNYKISSINMGVSTGGYYSGRMALFESCSAQVGADGNYVAATKSCQRNSNSIWTRALIRTQSIELSPTEFVVRATGYSVSNGLTCLTIATSNNRQISTCSTRGGIWFDFPIGSDFFGFSGRAGEILDALGFNFVDKVVDICGDGKVTGTEQCDLALANGASGSCCTSSCTFSSSSTFCRNVTGSCDLPEKCTGNSDACPADSFQALGTPCGELFGACDVSISRSCNGVSPQCFGPPAAPFMADGASKWSDFTVTSFGNYKVHGGDVEGRLAVRGNVSLDGFTAGLELKISTDGYQPFTVLVGGDAKWTSGELHPNSNDDPKVKGEPAFITTGGDFTGAASSYLANQYIDNGTSIIADSFGPLQEYYTAVQSQLSNLPINTANSLIYGDGLKITCNNKNDLLYHVSVDGDLLSKVNWYSTSNCNFVNNWVIDVTGSSDVTIRGGAFPGVVERVIYNILGSGRVIKTNNGLAGHILAPQNSLNQPSGVTYGLVIVGDVIIAKQNNKPNCKNFRNVTISAKLCKAMQSGSNIIYVVDFPDYAVGDRICINSDCQIIKSGFTSGSCGGLVLQEELIASHTIEELTEVVKDPLYAAYQTPVSYDGQKPDTSIESSASMIGAFFACIAIVLV